MTLKDKSFLFGLALMIMQTIHIERATIWIWLGTMVLTTYGLSGKDNS